LENLISVTAVNCPPDRIRENIKSFGSQLSIAVQNQPRS